MTEISVTQFLLLNGHTGRTILVKLVVIEISISCVYTLDLPDELPTPSTTTPATSPPPSAASERRKAFMMRQLDVVDASGDESSAAVDCLPSGGACLKPPPAKPPRSFTASLESSSLAALDHVDPLPSLSIHQRNTIQNRIFSIRFYFV